MWCVAELNEDYIAKMEDVLETYEQPYDPKQPVVCLDEKPVHGELIKSCGDWSLVQPSTVPPPPV